ncbi:MAG: helix-turn-helix domain-containing protein [Thermoanaerobaculia bacterium]
MGRRERVSREQVLEAARELFAVRGFEGTTLAAIAARVDLSPAALLRHESTKERLFHAAMAPRGGEIHIPIQFLAEVDAARRDPREVLREVGERFVPFIEEKLGETIALWLRSNVRSGASSLDSLPLLFDRAQHPTPPERALALLEGYLRRARRAGRMEITDTRAAAVAFLASLHSFVALHRLARAIEPPLPLDRFLDSLIEIWSIGAVRDRRPVGAKGSSKTAGTPRPRARSSRRSS